MKTSRWIVVGLVLGFIVTGVALPRFVPRQASQAQTSTRVFELLHRAEPVLLNFADLGRLDVGSWGDRVRVVDARYPGAWELPVLGEVAPPSAVLVRPDGHVAWGASSSARRMGRLGRSSGATPARRPGTPEHPRCQPTG